MKKIILVLLILTLNSCNYFGKGNGVKFEIKNNSESTITNVKIYTSEKLNSVNIEKIEPNKTVSDYLSMINNKSDGDYHIEFKSKNGLIEKSKGGYYTNGGVLDSWIEFEIKNDTIIYKSGDNIF